jgi:hypothetical protein
MVSEAARGINNPVVKSVSKGAGVASTALMTGVAGYNIYNSLNNGAAVNRKDVADLSVGVVGLGTAALVTFGIVSNPVGWVIGGGVALYSLGSLAYDLFSSNW